MQVHESIGAEVRQEATYVFELDFQFPYPALGGIVVRWYCRISQKIEDVIPAFQQAVLERGLPVSSP